MSSKSGAIHFRYIPDRNAHGDEDQRKLAYLDQGQTSEKAGALALAHRPHDRQDDQRLPRQRADKADGSSHDQQQGHFGKGGQIWHSASCPGTWPFRPGHGIVGAV